MPKSRWIAGVVFLLAALAVTLFRPAEPVAAAPPEEREFGKDVALRVTRKQAGEFHLSNPQAVRVGERSFLYGWRIGGDAAAYIPVSEIELIEEFGNVETLRKHYKLPGAQPGGTVVEEKKTTTEKK